MTLGPSDAIAETDSDVVSLGEMHYSKATSRPIRMVVAVAGVADLTDHSVQRERHEHRRDKEQDSGPPHA